MLVLVPQASDAHLSPRTKRVSRRCNVSQKVCCNLLENEHKTTGISKLEKLPFVALLCVLFNHVGLHPRGATSHLQPAALRRISMKILVRM